MASTAGFHLLGCGGGIFPPKTFIVKLIIIVKFSLHFFALSIAVLYCISKA